MCEVLSGEANILIDILEGMSLEEGSRYNENLIPISRGDLLPNREIPVEWITYDLWESMRAFDKELADGILEPVFVFMRAQTDKARFTIRGMGPYLEYREKDVGKAYVLSSMLSLLIIWSTGIDWVGFSDFFAH